MSSSAFSAYDSRGLRLLSGAFDAVLPEFERGCLTPLSLAERADVKQKIASNLMRAYDDGEREPMALNRAALQGLPPPYLPPKKTRRAPRRRPRETRMQAASAMGLYAGD